MNYNFCFCRNKTIIYVTRVDGQARLKWQLVLVQITNNEDFESELRPANACRSRSIDQLIWPSVQRRESVNGKPSRPTTTLPLSAVDHAHTASIVTSPFHHLPLSFGGRVQNLSTLYTSRLNINSINSNH